MNKELKESGLADKFQISAETNNPHLARFIGKVVKYKIELTKDSEWLRSNGTITVTSVFLIKETQLNYAGIEMLRGYATDIDDHFGRVINPDDVEIVEI